MTDHGTQISSRASSSNRLGPGDRSGAPAIVRWDNAPPSSWEWDRITHRSLSHGAYLPHSPTTPSYSGTHHYLPQPPQATSPTWPSQPHSHLTQRLHPHPTPTPHLPDPHVPTLFSLTMPIVVMLEDGRERRLPCCHRDVLTCVTWLASYPHLANAPHRSIKLTISAITRRDVIGATRS